MPRTYLLVDAYNVLLTVNGKIDNLRGDLRKIQTIVLQKKWLEGERIEIVIDSHRKNVAVQREEACGGRMELVWTYENRKTKIPYTADDYIIDEVSEKGDEFDRVIVVTSDERLKSNLVCSRISNLEFVSAENFMQGRF